MFLLFLSIALLFIAPILNVVSLKKDYFFSSLNGFVFVIIAALVGLDIIPRLLHTTGPEIILVILFGLALPRLIEKLVHKDKEIHKIAVLAGTIGLIIHTLADGAALTMHSAEQNLAIGVAIHRIPIGLFVWWFVKPNFGTIAAYLMLAIIAISTLFGFNFADSLTTTLHSSSVAYFQAFVAGTLIHVLFHKPPTEKPCHTRIKLNQRAEGIGSLFGLVCVFYLLTSVGRHQAEADWPAEFFDTVVYILLETAPLLLLAFIFAGVIKAFMPDSFVNWLKHGRSTVQATKGMAVGIPLPLCSCSIIPVYHSLVKKGVPQSAAVAFLIATPELGIDAILISLPLLGSDLTVIRLICAAILAVVVALVVAKYSQKNKHEHVIEATSAAPALSFGEKFKSGMHYSIHDLLDHIAPWILVGILIAALIHPVLGNLSLATIPSYLQVVLFAVLGIPVYVCASSATPLVAVFLINGVSPGAGLAFLLAGPATNISTFGVLSKLHNRQTAILLAISCLVTAITLGMLTNALLPNFEPIALSGDIHGFNWLNWACLVMLLALFTYSVYRRGMRAFVLELIPHNHIHAHDHADCGHDHSHDHGHSHSHSHDDHSNCSHDHSHQHEHSHEPEDSHSHTEHGKCSHHHH